MKILKSHYNQSIKVHPYQKENITECDSFYFRAIENADGIPYQMIFLPQTAEGCYLNIGSGIQKLVGIPSDDFNEESFLLMIEEVVPGSGDYHADIMECRRKLINGDIKNIKLDILIRSVDGSKKWIKDSSIPLIDKETGKVIGAFGILHNITNCELDHEKINKSRVDLYSLLRRVYDQHQPAASHKGLILRLSVSPDARNSEINTDRCKLMKVLSNLVGNSIKFTYWGKVQFGYSLKEDLVEFYISGTGIPEEHQAVALSMFCQADSSSTWNNADTSPGLAIAKAYIELLGGQIFFESTPDEGSMFRFTLPFGSVLRLM